MATEIEMEGNHALLQNLAPNPGGTAVPWLEPLFCSTPSKALATPSSLFATFPWWPNVAARSFLNAQPELRRLFQATACQRPGCGNRSSLCQHLIFSVRC